MGLSPTSNHQLGELFESGPKGIGDLAPLRDGGLVVFLDGGVADHGGGHVALALGDVGERVSHEVNAAVLPGGVQDLGDSRREALVGVGDDQLDAPEPTARQEAQEVGPEGFRLGRADASPTVRYPA